MENRNGYLMQGSLAAMLALGLLLLVCGPAFAAGLKDSTFKGSYLTSYQGFDSSITGTTGEPNPPAIPYAVSGEIVSNGKGAVNGFENIKLWVSGHRRCRHLYVHRHLQRRLELQFPPRSVAR
jgi:hypothetical protein